MERIFWAGIDRKSWVWALKYKLINKIFMHSKYLNPTILFLFHLSNMDIISQYLSTKYIHLLYHLLPKKLEQLNLKQIYSTEILFNKNNSIQLKYYYYVFLNDIGY